MNESKFTAFSARRGCLNGCYKARYFWRLRSRPLRVASISRSLWSITQSSESSCLSTVETGASTCLREWCLLLLSRSSPNADANVENSVCRIFLVAHNECDSLDLFHRSRPSSFSPESNCPSCSSTVTILDRCKSHRDRELGGMSNECCCLLRLLRKQWRV